MIFWFCKLLAKSENHAEIWPHCEWKPLTDGTDFIRCTKGFWAVMSYNSESIQGVFINFSKASNTHTHAHTHLYMYNILYILFIIYHIYLFFIGINLIHDMIDHNDSTSNEEMHPKLSWSHNRCLWLAIVVISWGTFESNRYKTDSHFCATIEVQCLIRFAATPHIDWQRMIVELSFGDVNALIRMKGELSVSALNGL